MTKHDTTEGGFHLPENCEYCKNNPKPQETKPLIETHPSYVAYIMDLKNRDDLFSMTVEEVEKGIQETTLDKAKVREAIEYVKSCGTFTNRNWDIVLKQKLGLDE